jgi:hypothetical protein
MAGTLRVQVECPTVRPELVEGFIFLFLTEARGGPFDAAFGVAQDRLRQAQPERQWVEPTPYDSGRRLRPDRPLA